MKKRVFSGSRPTERLHLGNYLGGVRGYLVLQERGDLDCIYSVVDLHGITTSFNPETLIDIGTYGGCLYEKGVPESHCQESNKFFERINSERGDSILFVGEVNYEK